MELILPALAIGGIYIANRQARHEEQFRNQEPFSNTFSGSDMNPSEPNMDVTRPANESEYKDWIEAESKPGPATQSGYASANVQSAIPGQASIRLPGTGETWNAKYIGVDTQARINAGENGHANMAIHRRKRGDIDMYDDKGYASTELEKRMGYGSAMKPKKREQLAMFHPEQNISFPHGAPSMTDELRKREYISNKMGGASPIQPIHQASGVLVSDAGLLHAGSNDSMNRSRPEGRTVDQLRTANNPKFGGSKYATYEGLQGPSDSRVKKNANVEQFGTAERREVKKTAYERGEKWSTPAGGAYLGAKARENIKPANVRRVDSEAYTPAATSDVKGMAIRGIEKKCTKNEYGELPAPMNRGSSGAEGVRNTFSRPTVIQETKRVAYDNTNYFGAIGRVIGRMLDPHSVTPKESFREMYSETTQTYLAPSSTGAIGSSHRRYTEQSAENRPRTTMRDLAAKAPMFLHVSGVGGKTGEGYISSQVQAAETNRHHTGEVRYTSAACGTSQVADHKADYEREFKDTHNATLHSSRPLGGLDLHQSEVTNLYLADDARKQNRAEGYASGPSAIPSGAQAGVHSILEYNYRAPHENTRANVDRSNYNNIHSGLTVQKMADGLSQIQSI